MRMQTLVVAVLAVTGCAASTSPRLTERQLLDAYRASAGAPIKSFSALGGINSWSEIDDRHLAVWTARNQAYLLELAFSCPNLESAYSVGIANSAQRVESGFDSVIVGSSFGDAGPSTCPIRTIWPIDTDVLEERRAEFGRSPAIQVEAVPQR